MLLDGGKLVRTGSNGAAWDRLFTLGPGGGTLEGSSGSVAFNSTGTVPFSGTGSRTLFLSGSQTDNNFSFKLTDPPGGKLSLTKVGNGRWIINGTNSQSYSGDTTVSAGTLIMNGNSNILPFGPGRGNLVINSGTFELNGRDVQVNALIGGGNLNNRSGTHTMTLGNGDASGTFSGPISSAGGTLNIVKTGAGVEIFTGANTSVGSTTVNNGVMQYNAANSIGGSAANVTVNASGIAAAGYAMDQTFLGRITTTSTGAVALAANSAMR